MKYLSLIKAKNHDLLGVYQEGNSFGDQILTYVLEKTDGTKLEHKTINEEGQWTHDINEHIAFAKIFFKGEVI